mmetsp:Transcript_24252/g.75601  ORF Transcript_24252/g.75601 Transcript_24252/m.75601 type:complete len:288 (-) Transcript_24252:1193-2056(-)
MASLLRSAGAGRSRRRRHGEHGGEPRGGCDCEDTRALETPGHKVPRLGVHGALDLAPRPQRSILKCGHCVVACTCNVPGVAQVHSAWARVPESFVIRRRTSRVCCARGCNGGVSAVARLARKGTWTRTARRLRRCTVSGLTAQAPMVSVTPRVHVPGAGDHSCVHGTAAHPACPGSSQLLRGHRARCGHHWRCFLAVPIRAHVLRIPGGIRGLPCWTCGGTRGLPSWRCGAREGLGWVSIATARLCRGPARRHGVHYRPRGRVPVLQRRPLPSHAGRVGSVCADPVV